jgi:hypothetical protein
LTDDSEEPAEAVVYCPSCAAAEFGDETANGQGV